MRFGIDQARRAWLTANDVLNKRPIAELRKLPGALEAVIELAAGWFERHLVVDPAGADRSAGQ
jgi:hypothetical protein